MFLVPLVKAAEQLFRQGLSFDLGGIQMQAQALNKKIAALEPVDLIVTSPLTRAMDTMQLAFAGVEAPKVRPS
jgi:phosphohistidine phosphatase SixA